MASIESDETLPEGYVVGRIDHVRERYPLQRLLHEAKKSKDWNLMTEATLTKLNNPGKRLLIPVLKPYEHSTAPLVVKTPVILLFWPFSKHKNETTKQQNNEKQRKVR